MRDPVGLRHEEDLVTKGGALFNQGEYEASIEWFDKELSENPGNKEALLMRARALEMLGKLGEAEAELTHLIDIDADYPGALLERAELYAAQKKFGKAYDDLLVIFKQDRGGYSTHVLTAMVCIHIGKPIDAIEHAQTATQVIGSPPIEAHLILAQIYAAYPDEQVRNGPSALEHAEIANHMTAGKDPAALATLAMANAELGNYEEAVQYQTKAIQLVPEPGRAALNEQLALYKSARPYRLSLAAKTNRLSDG
jgi:tetratricopeptide (TPR) repeat protein